MQNLPFASEIELKPPAPGEMPMMTAPLSVTGDRDMRLEVPELAVPPRRHQSPLEEGEREPDTDVDERIRYAGIRYGELRAVGRREGGGGVERADEISGAGGR